MAFSCFMYLLCTSIDFFFLLRYSYTSANLACSIIDSFGSSSGFISLALWILGSLASLPLEFYLSEAVDSSRSLPSRILLNF